MVPSRTLICGIAAGERSMPLISGAITSRAFGPCHGDDSPLLGGRGQPDVEIGEFRLQIILMW